MIAPFYHTKIALTGSDAAVLFNYLQGQFPEIASQIVVDSNLIFWRMRSACSSASLSLNLALNQANFG
jgi:type III pantothenate kinase